MNIVLFEHPAFIDSQSMPRFARALRQGLEQRGHRVEVRTAGARLRARLGRPPLAKWAGYADQYLLYAPVLRAQAAADPADTLYVFCDQALGPWVPALASRPHVVHVHDLLALRSALGLHPENPTAWSGRLYQRFIRRGFRRGRHFIAVSGQSLADLRAFGGVAPVTAEVVHNGMNQPFVRLDLEQACQRLRAAGLPVEPQGMLLHVSGGTWYKNVAGLVRLYSRYCEQVAEPLPLWLVGVPPSTVPEALMRALPARARLEFVRGLSTAELNAAYAAARTFVFPSLYEGFGWPIVEAQACGCPVLTTDAPPMNEIGGPMARYLPRLGAHIEPDAWARHGAALLAELAALEGPARERVAQRARAWAERFTQDAAIDGYLRVYQRVLDLERPCLPAAAGAVH